MAKLKDGFYKQTTSSIGSDLHVLLAGGGSKALSDFAYKSDLTGFVTGGPYLPLTGGTLTGDLTLKASSASGFTPKIHFLRGTFDDTYQDWSVGNESGGLHFYCDYGEGVNDVLTLGKTSATITGTLTATAGFIGDLTGSATKIGKYTVNDIFTRQSRPDTEFNIDEIELFGMRDIQPSSEITRAGTFPFDGWGSLMSFNGQNYFVQLATASTSSGMYFRSAYGAAVKLTDKPWVKFLDSRNYSTYALPLSGGTLTSSGVTTLNLKDTARNESSISYAGNGGAQWFVGKGVGQIGENFGFYNGTKGVVANLDINGNFYATKFVGPLQGNADTSSDSAKLGGVDASLYMKAQALLSSTDINDQRSLGIFRYNGISDKHGPEAGTAYGNLMVIKAGNHDTLTQIYFNYDNAKVFVRSGNTGGSTADVSNRAWHQLAFTSDIPAVTNYYWADQLITSSAKADTTPTFGGATINGNLSVTRVAGSAVPAIPLQVTGTGTGTGQRLIQAFSPDLPTGTSGAYGAHIILGVKDSARNFGYMKFVYAGDGSVNNAIRFGFHSSDNLMSIVTNGNVGIGTTNPAYALDVNGTIRANGNVYATAYYESSDIRLKNFIKDVSVDLNKIRAIPKKYFTWKKDTSSIQIGTSAQAVQKLYPELVSSNTDGYLSVDYSKLSVIALKGIDELYDMILELRAENRQLREQIRQMQK